jgi:hypothetical protein
MSAGFFINNQILHRETEGCKLRLRKKKKEKGKKKRGKDL